MIFVKLSNYYNVCAHQHHTLEFKLQKIYSDICTGSSSFRSQVTPGNPIGFSEQEVQGLAIP
jgi:hypothetical protein